jgi:hypothetical protein
MLEELGRYESELKELKSQSGQIQGMVERALSRSVLLEQKLQQLADSDERFNRVRTSSRDWKTVFWIVAALVVGCAVFLLATLARAQGAFQSFASSAPKLMLCDLDLELVPLDTQGKPEKINVTLKFSSLSADRKLNTATIQISSGRNSITLEPASPLIDSKVSLVQHSNNLITVDVPTTYSPTLGRVRALSQSMIQYKVPPGYTNEVLLANQLSFSYTMSGAEVVHTRVAGTHLLHLFPFDYVEVDIPIDVRQAALLSHLELQKPASAYSAHVTVEGLPIDLTESENGDRYDFANADPMVRTPMWAGKPVRLKATFRRTWFGSWGLIAIVLCCGIAGGALAGYTSKLPDKSRKAQVLTALGVGSTGGGLVLAISTSVLDAHKELPTVLAGKATVFELVVGLTLLLMLVAVVVTRKVIR